MSDKFGIGKINIKLYSYLGAPFIVGGRSIQLFRLEDRAIIQKVMSTIRVPEECCVSFAQFVKSAVFIGKLEGKLLPVAALKVNDAEVNAIAAELQLRLKRYSAAHN